MRFKFSSLFSIICSNQSAFVNFSDIVRNFQSQQLTWVDYSPKFMRQILGDSTTTAPFTAAATTVAKPPATTAAKPPLVYAKKSKPT